MSQPTSIPLEYEPDSGRLFRRLAQLPWPVFLDSGGPGLYAETRYDILAASPTVTLTSFGPLTRIQSGQNTHWSFEDPFELVKRELQSRALSPDQRLPFQGGAIGYWGYDLARRIEDLPDRRGSDDAMPEMAVGIYDWALVVDHQQQETWLTGSCPDEVLMALKRDPPPADKRIEIADNLESNMDWDQYAHAFERVMRYIKAGDCYQVNLARRFSVPLKTSPLALYERLRSLSPAPYSAFLATPYGSVLSSSPERFLHVRQGRVETRPIKGTRARGSDEHADQQLAAELQNSAKDHAENVMIVDLLRNDLGKSCVPGSIEVPAIAELHSFSNVHHLVSRVTGSLDPARHPMDLFRDCFPGGSITGAPKVRAMEIIDELEPERRGVYCGSIGYVGFDGGMDTNIAIRTVVHRNHEASFWAGGGLVADSSLKEEYQEILDKAYGMFALLNTTSSV